jgi:hypothetical protein
MMLLYALLLNGGNLTFWMDHRNYPFLLLLLLLNLNQIIMLTTQILSSHYDSYHTEWQTQFENLPHLLTIKLHLPIYALTIKFYNLNDNKQHLLKY